MKKRITLMLAVLMLASPAWAEVLITCVTDGCDVTVSYDASGEPNLVRGFGLDITVDSGATIDSVTVLDANYRVYPGQIVIQDGNVIDYNVPYPGTLGANSITVELGSLYTTDSNYSGDPNAGYNMIPGTSGDLLEFTVSSDCNVVITDNAARGGVVLENPALNPDVNSPGCEVISECFYVGMVDKCGRTITQPMYDVWAGTIVNKDECWCYDCHCKGDTDDNATVNNDDVTVALNGWISYPNGYCADTDYNGTVNNDDVTEFLDGWINGCP